MNKVVHLATYRRAEAVLETPAPALTEDAMEPHQSAAGTVATGSSTCKNGQLPDNRPAAKALGLKFYFTGRPCRRGHVEPRPTSSGQCPGCNREDALKRYHRRVEGVQRRAWVKGRDPKDRASNSAEKRKEYEDRRYQKHKADPAWRLKRNLRYRLYITLKGRKKNASVLELIGCPLEGLIAHLEARFKPGMTWANYGEWHVDHIKPCAWFDMTDPKQVRDCWSYTNLQPLWASENCSKAHRYSEAA